MQVLFTFGTVFLFCASLYNIIPFHLSKSYIAGMAVLLTILLQITLLFEESISFIILMLIPIFILYRISKNLYKNSICVVLSTIIFALIDFISGNIFLFITGYGKEEIRANLIIYMIYIVSTYLFLFPITKIIGNLLKKKRLFEFEISSRISIIFTISLLVILIIYYVNIHAYSNEYQNNSMFSIKSLMFFLQLVITGILFYIFYHYANDEMKIKRKEDNFKQLNDYTENLENLYADMRAFRHDYINILASMSEYMKEKNIEGLETYFYEKIYPMGKFIEEKNYRLAALKNMFLAEVKGILYIKLIHAQEMGIDVHIEMTEPIKAIQFDIVDFCRVLGILLDNAIEAAKETRDAYIHLAFVKKEASVLFIISNSYPGDISLAEINSKGFSTKGGGRGIGLDTLRKTINQYSNVLLETIADGKEFRQVIDIRNHT